MLQIMPYSGAVNFRKLRHGAHVFHDALEGVLKGGKEYPCNQPRRRGLLPALY